MTSPFLSYENIGELNKRSMILWEFTPEEEPRSGDLSLSISEASETYYITRY